MEEDQEAKELFDSMSLSAMMDLGLTEDEAENALEDYYYMQRGF